MIKKDPSRLRVGPLYILASTYRHPYYQSKTTRNPAAPYRRIEIS